MKATLITIGNSKGVRIPASVIKACGFRDALEMRVENGAVVLEAVHGIRANWGAAFARMAAAGDDALLLAEYGNDFDDEEWAW